MRFCSLFLLLVQYDVDRQLATLSFFFNNPLCHYITLHRVCVSMFISYNKLLKYIMFITSDALSISGFLLSDSLCEFFIIFFFYIFKVNAAVLTLTKKGFTVWMRSAHNLTSRISHYSGSISFAILSETTTIIRVSLRVRNYGHKIEIIHTQL